MTAKLCTFGSYRLGVDSPGADIDILCIGPKHIDRESFFTDLKELLSQHPKTTEVTGIPDAYVPIMTCVFDGIQLDIAYAKLDVFKIPEDLDFLDDACLRGLDPKSVLAMNGCRVTDMILSLVPNIVNYRFTLRFIKYWAKQRGLYSNVMGYFGGVSWAILVARVCQLFPNALPFDLVLRFFRYL